MKVIKTQEKVAISRDFYIVMLLFLLIAFFASFKIFNFSLVVLKLI